MVSDAIYPVAQTVHIASGQGVTCVIVCLQYTKQTVVTFA